MISVSISDDKTKNRMATIDRNQIQTAINTVLNKESYLALMPDDFELICPNPSGMIHLVGKTPKDAISQLKEETDCLRSKEISGAICFIQSHCLRMRELEEIDKLLPPAVQLKKGLYFDKPAEGDVEIYLFYSIPKSYAFGVNLELGYTCIGICMDESLVADVVLTDVEVESIKAWLKAQDGDELDRSKMAEDLPDVYDKIDSAIQDVLLKWAVQDGVDNGNYAYDNGWDMFEKDMRSGDFRPESAGEDFDPEDYLEDEECFDEWESHQPSVGDEGWEDYYEERYGAISGLDLGAIDYSVEFPEEILE